MTIDARTAAPEPPLHAATLLSRTRLAQCECAARLGISERTLRYHLTGRPMSYALRCLFERLADACEIASHPFLQGTAPPKKRRFTGPGELESSGYIDRIEEMRKSMMAVSWAEEEQKTLADLLSRIPQDEVRCDPHVLTGLYAMNCRIVASGYSHAIEALGKPNRDTTPEESKAIQHVLDHGFRRSVWT